ncbi:hypothetical protein [Sphingosinicella sp. CPCC 101087]|uniref:hypothetical protein n=1 Tax=Sphingosinicella sp. CPCC 101087 TaxID=2497754 RepID=UPI00101D1DB8|nr:hypothetical protein [Sphingosinicella sp. CPCC 101087]
MSLASLISDLAARVAAEFNAVRSELPAGEMASLNRATSVQLRAHAGDAGVTAARIADALAWVALADGATIAVDWSAGITREISLAGNRTLGNPTNVVPGSTRLVLVKGNNATARSLAFGTNYRGDLPTIADATSTKWYLLTLVAYSSTHIVVVSVRAL